MEINKDIIKQLSETIMIDLTEKEIEDSLSELSVLDNQINHLKSIDTSGIEPMIFPFEESVNYLRDDEESHVLSIQEVLLNAPDKEDQFFKVAKVETEE